MQSNIVKAFRLRLVRAGFKDVSIYDCCNGKYMVYCTSSDDERIRKEMTEIQMNAMPRIVWFD